MTWDKVLRKADYEMCITYPFISKTDYEYIKSCWEQQEWKRAKSINANGFYALKNRYLSPTQMNICRRIISKCSARPSNQMR